VGKKTPPALLRAGFRVRLIGSYAAPGRSPPPNRETTLSLRLGDYRPRLSLHSGMVLDDATLMRKQDC
jgi:hypothetical protein